MTDYLPSIYAVDLRNNNYDKKTYYADTIPINYNILLNKLRNLLLDTTSYTAPKIYNDLEDILIKGNIRLFSYKCSKNISSYILDDLKGTFLRV